MQNPSMHPYMHQQNVQSPHQYQPQPQQQQYNPLYHFQEELKTVTNPDGRKIQQLTELAKNCHGRYSLQVVESLVERIYNGEYRDLFESQIVDLFNLSFNTPRIEEKRSLIKMFKIWDLFFQPEILIRISQQWQLQEYEKRLLTESDQEKVEKFKRDFEPTSLPDDVYQSGLYIAGRDTNNMGGSYGHQMNVNYRGQAIGDRYGMTQHNVSNFISHGTALSQPGPAIGLSNTGAQPYLNNTTIPQQPAPQPESGSALAIYEQLRNLVTRSAQPPPSSIIGQHQQQHQPQYPPQQSTYPNQGPSYQQPYGSRRGTERDDMMNHHIMNGVNGGVRLPPNAGDSSVMQYGFNNALIVDHNFQLRTNVDQTQFGFLPSILKSFQQFKFNQQLLLGQEARMHHGLPSGSTQPPSFMKPNTIKELYIFPNKFYRINLFAINEVYEGVKFQCAICGMRFIRNQILKKHLDNHFNKNNEFRRRGNRAVSRPEFMSLKDFVQPKSQLQNAKGGGQSGQLGQKLNEEMVPYSNKDVIISKYKSIQQTNCYICKEKFEVVFDEEEESWFFVGAKKIRLHSNTQKDSAQLQQKKASQIGGGQLLLIIVHSDCIKQIELNREYLNRLQLKDSFKGDNPAQLFDEKQDPTTTTIQEQIQGQEKVTNSKIDIEELERQIRGLQSSKRQFIGKE